MEDKPFKTLDDQIQLLKSRNMRFRNEENAKYVLINNSYYGGQFFEDMLAIYDFDKSLASILYKYIMTIETTFKTSLSYYISHDLGSMQNQYLDKTKYSNGYRISTGNFSGSFSIEKTFFEINQKIKDTNITSIRHYTENHKNVPPWIVMPTLSLGVIYEWYRLVRPPIKTNVANTFLYSDRDETLNKEIFQQSLKTIHLYRNIVAHGSRLIMHEMPIEKRLRPNLIKQYAKSNIINNDMCMIDHIEFLLYFQLCAYFFQIDQQLRKTLSMSYDIYLNN
ncbi:hypothetical protein UAY_03064 [Enterococcus moraviensis ATCC BAA-383]|uniref:Abortive infection bacteriophage resistance protein n=1 Tax=Enterococcus moraviensis ATCC BAA-383 TaxID=1158609 RepID=R2T7B9_9ENTE|nr:Abi family protein [Enterococcus moraviensis]EOH96154.1 hypothetical protein UAY_03064 [Enterococcus moraviensis ATCC BAA-383]EOT66126.1 hypothetical protein I586_02397 [Enterococcus moraviensis ATCC BAA-383]OJG65732.1 hypothetical protein RV09_GL001072 [Enterococcus moraviensis]